MVGRGLVGNTLGAAPCTGLVGRGICIMGTLINGCCGWLDLNVNSRGLFGCTSNPSGNVTVALNIRPGCTSFNSTSTPSIFTLGSLSASWLVPRFWIEIDGEILFVSGARGKTICCGVTAITCWMLAHAVTEMTGMFVNEVFTVILPWTVGR